MKIGSEHDTHTKILTSWIFHLKNWANQNWELFYLKKNDREFRFRDFRVDDRRWPGLQSNCAILMHFWLKIEWVRMRNRLACNVICCPHFYLRYYFFFLSLQSPNSCCIFLIVSLLLFGQCFDMCCTQLFACGFAWFLAFWFYKYNCLLALFFLVVFCITSWVLLPKYSLSHFLFFAGFSRRYLWVFFGFLTEQFAYCCVGSAFAHVMLYCDVLFALLNLFALIFLLISDGHFFLFLFDLHKFAIARFRFFWLRCFFFRLPFAYTHSYRNAHLFLPLHSYK